MEGLVILIATLVVLLGFGIFILVKVIKGPKLPDGIKFEAKDSGNKAVVIVDKDLPSIKDKDTGKVVAWIVGGVRITGEELAKKCALSMTATEAAFIQKGVQKADVDRVVFLYKTDENYEEGVSEYIVNSAAYATTAKGMFGKGVPMAIIRSKHMKTTYERAQPAVHELVHILNEEATGDYSHSHADPNLWNGPGGDDSVEGIAVIKWKELIKTL